ncbi:hypothetical protein DSO57_1019800 [Entomophthora muscae]|uniref:Uncharacterized protein n=1 Tax=Entomophthora muscae TaxID=34485 RepID=A0ACC2RIL2_9FUNG|nr:hypothetical protein DSO57_1019800 [Entomophthora muscae]
MVQSSVQMETCPGTGISTEYCNNGKWAPVVPGRCYTAYLFATNPLTKQQAQSTSTKTVKTTLFCPFASISLLTYLGAYTYLGHFNLLLGRYQILGEFLHLGMVSIAIGSMIIGLNPSALIHHVGKLFPAGWVPDIITFVTEPHVFSVCIIFATHS